MVELVVVEFGLGVVAQQAERGAVLVEAGPERVQEDLGVCDAEVALELVQVSAVLVVLVLLLLLLLLA